MSQYFGSAETDTYPLCLVHSLRLVGGIFVEHTEYILQVFTADAESLILDLCHKESL